MTFLQKAILGVCRPIFSLLFSWRVEGKENIPLNGPFILITNHLNLVDPFLLLFAFPRWINFVAKEELFHSPFLRFWLHWAGSVPISRNGKVRDKQKTLRSARYALERGAVLGMFPEGGRSQDAKLTEGKPGCAIIAVRTNVPLLPVGIIGTDKVKGISWLWRRPRIIVRIGKPINLPPVNNRLSRSQMRSLTTQLMEEIAALLPPEYRGAYGSHENREG
ncbi:MAG: lysophospholipid acyltransferase family protein [Dehalococcoidia bacterium]